MPNLTSVFLVAVGSEGKETGGRFECTDAAGGASFFLFPRLGRSPIPSLHAGRRPLTLAVDLLPVGGGGLLLRLVVLRRLPRGVILLLHGEALAALHAWPGRRAGWLPAGEKPGGRERWLGRFPLPPQHRRFPPASLRGLRRTTIPRALRDRGRRSRERPHAPRGASGPRRASQKPAEGSEAGPGSPSPPRAAPPPPGEALRDGPAAPAAAQPPAASSPQASRREGGGEGR